MARSSSAAETQAAADGDDEAVDIRLSSKEVLFGQVDLQIWQSEARQIPAALGVDCRGVYDALPKVSWCSEVRRKTKLKAQIRDKIRPAESYVKAYASPRQGRL